MNDKQRDRFLRKVRSDLWRLKGKRLGVPGLAFKGGSDDIRESPAISMVDWLMNGSAQVQAHDPAAAERACELLPARNMLFVDSACDAAEGADALLVLTAWNEFKQLDYARIRCALRYPNMVDGKICSAWERGAHPISTT